MQTFTKDRYFVSLADFLLKSGLRIAKKTPNKTSLSFYDVFRFWLDVYLDVYYI
jgi:hypothetical protein